MLTNAYFLAKFRFDTAENEPAKNLQNFRKMQVGRAFLERAAAFIGELEADAELALLDPTDAASAGREAEALALFGIPYAELGCCRVIQHPNFGPRAMAGIYVLSYF